MKRKQYRRKTAICPFYNKEDQQTVYCKGLIPNTSIHIAFGNSRECSVLKLKNCREYPQRCPIYKMLEEFYNGLQ